MGNDWVEAKRKADRTAKWAITMTKWHIRRVAARVRWQLVTFNGPSGAESAGIVDLLAVRKNHRKPETGRKRGDALEIILVQVKGGTAARPTLVDAQRMRTTARSVGAQDILFAEWKKGSAVRFYRLSRQNTWLLVPDLASIFR
jgi:hypothetical protein